MELTSWMTDEEIGVPNVMLKMGEHDELWHDASMSTISTRWSKAKLRAHANGKYAS